MRKTIILLLTIYSYAQCWDVLNNVYLKKQSYSIDYNSKIKEICDNSYGGTSYLSQEIGKVSPVGLLPGVDVPSFSIGGAFESETSCWVYGLKYFNSSHCGTAESVQNYNTAGEIDKIKVMININHGEDTPSTNDDWQWAGSKATPRPRNLGSILKHELIHCLGGAHGWKSPIMRDVYIASTNNLPVDDDNIIAVNAIYNPPKYKITDWLTATPSAEYGYNFIKGQHFKFSVEQGSTTAVNNYKVGFYHSPDLTILKPLWEGWFAQTVFDVPAQ